jgi:RimJ/RimL family protein N-acetyltransferase
MAVLGPTLMTSRLILRPPAAQDFEAFAEFAADTEAARLLGGAQSPETAWVTRGFSMLSVRWDIYGQCRAQWRARRDGLDR